MEPVTHLLTGACLARTGFHRRVRYATLAMAIAAEFPDIDTLWSLQGPVSGFRHHRGITHTFLGVPVEAGLLLLVCFLYHRSKHGRARSDPRSPLGYRHRPSAPVRWGALYGCLLLALLSHLLLDFTNNYGLRPFFPFNPRWYAASIVFIFDPLMFLLLVAGLVAPELFALIGSEIAGRQASFRGSGWGRAALLGILGLWGLRSVEHSRAVALANGQTLRAPAADALQAPLPSDVPAAEVPRPLLAARRSLAGPDPFSPFRWYTATDFGPVYVLGTADSRRGSLDLGATLNKPEQTPALAAAETTMLGRSYLQWSPMPWMTQTTENSAAVVSAGRGKTTVRFEDVRFLNSTPLLQHGGPPPLTGFVILGDRDQVLEEGMNGRAQR